jgi:hypothetical protein
VRAADGPQCAPAAVADDVADVVADDVTDDVVALLGVAAEDPHAASAKTVTATIGRRLTQTTVRTAMSPDK